MRHSHLQRPRRAATHVRAAVAATIAVVATPASAGAQAASAPGATADAGESHLVVADVDAEVLTAWTLPDLEPAGELAGRRVADHAGFLTLPDGRLLFADAASHSLVAVEIDDGEIVEVGEAPLAGTPIHLAVDGDGAYAAASTLDDDGFTLVDLSTFEAVDVALETGEPGVFFGGDPLAVVHRNDEPAVLEVFPVDAVLAGEAAPQAVVEIGPAGHGEGITPDGLAQVITDDGVELFAVTGPAPEPVSVLPWDLDGRAGGRGYYLRLDPTGSYAWSYLRIIPEPADDAAFERWEDFGNDIYIADLESGTATRFELGPGLVYRLDISPALALYARMHPDADVAVLVDADPGSDTFQEVVAEIPLDPLSDGPVAGESPWDREARRVAIAADGSLGFVTHGGDGIVSVIDTATHEVVEHLDVGTPLHLGGYLTVVDAGKPLVDTIGR